MGNSKEEDEEPGNQLEGMPGTAPPTLAGVDFLPEVVRIRAVDWLVGHLHHSFHWNLSDSKSVGEERRMAQLLFCW